MPPIFLPQYMPPVDGRASCGYVGLKNAGATCYMNSVLQQLYMVPGVPESILSVDEDQPDEERWVSWDCLLLACLLACLLRERERE